MRALAWIVVAACGGSAQPPPEHAQEPPHHDGMPRRFDDANHWTTVFDAPDRDAWQKPDDVIAALTLKPSMTVADVGAGTGYFTVRIARAVPSGQVIATDIEPDMIRHLGERAKSEQLANIRAVLATGDDPALAPASVDRILIVDVWHHVADRKRYAAGLARALRPGGLIAIVDFTAESHRGPPPMHRLAPEVVIGDLAGAGLHASLSPTRLPDQYIVIATN